MELGGDVSFVGVALQFDVLLEKFPLFKVEASGQVLLGLAHGKVVLLVHFLGRGYLSGWD